MDPLTVLVTNDDGVASPGLAGLARAAIGPGRRVVVAAPASDQSGTSAAVSPRPAEGARVEVVRVAGLDGSGSEEIVAYAVDGPPALAVLAARLGELGPAAHAASIVLSGVNLGPNTGVAVLHSGTVGAALAAANFGLSSMAVSTSSMTPVHMSTATAVSAAALDWLVTAPAGTLLNINVPDVPLDRLAGVRQAPLACLGTVEAVVADRGTQPFTVGLGGRRPEPEAGSDAALLREGWVTVTSLVGIRAVGGAGAAGAIERAVSQAA